MAAPRYYLAPTQQGTGDGSSRANAAAYSHSKVLTRLAAWKSGVQSPAEDDPCPWGFKVCTGGTFNGQPASSTNPQVQGRFIRSHKVMKHETAAVTIAGRIILCSGLGDYSVTGSPAVSSDSHSGPGGAGTLQNPIRMYIIESDNGAGEPMDDTGGPVETVSTIVKGKAGTKADWDLSTNYNATTGNWTGSVVDRTHSFTVHRAKTGATIVGSRENDNRPNRKDYQLIVNGSRRSMYDPNGTKTTPIYLQPDGKTPYIGNQGDMFHMPTKTFVNRNGDTGFGLGNEFWRNGASYLIFRGIFFKNFKMPFSNFPNVPHKFLHFRDIKTDNTSYFIERGKDACDYWANRMENVAWSQKAHTLGMRNYRWLYQNVWMDGAFVVGDAIKCGFSAVAAETREPSPDPPSPSGPLIVENFYGTTFWDAITTDPDSNGVYPLNKYFQGEAFDYETYNLQVENFKIDLAGDGCFDTKPRTAWIGYRPIVLINGVCSRARRLLRLWPPAPDMLDGARERYNASLLIDIALQDARQYGIFAPVRENHHRIIDWDNTESGFANMANRIFPSSKTWKMVSTEIEGSENPDKQTGNLTVTVWQPLDLRPTGSSAMKELDNTATVPNPTTTFVYRRAIRTPNVPPPATPVLGKIGGDLQDPDNGAVIDGTVLIISPFAATWTNKTTGTLVVSSDKKSANYTKGT